MNQLKIVQVGNPNLRKPCVEVKDSDIKNAAMKELVRNMKYTLRKVGGVGLAAPQVGVHKRLCVIRIQPTKYRPNLETVPVYAMFNPKIVSAKNEGDCWEGCLSVAEANLFMQVKRPQEIMVSYLDEKGYPQLKTKTGLEAVVIQHEIDHLNGLVYLDRAPDLESVMSGAEYRKMLSNA